MPRRRPPASGRWSRPGRSAGAPAAPSARGTVSLLPEPVPRPAHREDQAWLLGLLLELLAQVADVDVDRARVAVGAVAPDRAQELLAGEELAGALHEAGQDLELRERHAHRRAGDGDLPRALVDRDRPDRYDALDDAPLGAAQHGADAAAQLGQAEGLGDVVGGAGLEALHDVGLAVERGQHDDRDDRAAGAQRAGDVVAGRTGPERDVEEHDVEVLLGRPGERRVPVGHGGHAMALALEGPREHVAQRLVVVDNEDVERRGGLHARWTVPSGPAAAVRPVGLRRAARRARRVRVVDLFARAG